MDGEGILREAFLIVFILGTYISVVSVYSAMSLFGFSDNNQIHC